MNSSERDATPAELPLVSSADVTDAGSGPAPIPVPAASGTDAHAGAEIGVQPGRWARLRRWISGTDGHQGRISALSDAVAAEPEAPMNYVLRGELRLNEREYFLAYSDFVRALTLAERALQTERWGLLAQVAQDRAAVGLDEAQRQLRSLKDDSKALHREDDARHDDAGAVCPIDNV